MKNIKYYIIQLLGFIVLFLFPIYFTSRQYPNEVFYRLSLAEKIYSIYDGKYLPVVREAIQEQFEELKNAVNREEKSKQLYDFFERWELRNQDEIIYPQLPGDYKQLPVIEKKQIKPIDVLNELETMPLPFNLENIDEKISLLKDKSFLANQRYVKAQLDGIIERLENRKKYNEYSEFFELFPNTNDEKIDLLISKYKLQIDKSDLFVPVFPSEAIKIMKIYTDKVSEIIKKKPVFYVIAEEECFKKKRERLDPILLVQSPFGFYWQILGAWDKEMLLLSEL